MVLKGIFAVLVATLIAAGHAADYRPDEFLGLDLSKAVLSPKRLGPASEFAPVRVEAKSEPSGVLAHGDARKVAVQRIKGVQARAELTAGARRGGHLAQMRADKPRSPARDRLAHRHSDPLNAQAWDTRIQTWPCRPDSGGICGWRQ
jgi:hypothetical protein